MPKIKTGLLVQCVSVTLGEPSKGRKKGREKFALLLGLIL